MAHSPLSQRKPAAPIPDIAPVLLHVGHWLKNQDYHFTTITPLSHQRYLDKRQQARRIQAENLRDIFGWNLPFKATSLPPEIFEALRTTKLIRSTDQGWQSQIRCSRLATLLMFHSGYPTEQSHAVFLGPDSYRFVLAIEHFLRTQPLPDAIRAVDIGCGAGAGALSLAQAHADAEILAVDINHEALALCEINAELASLNNIHVCASDLLNDVSGNFDLVVANPPYLLDSEGRHYRHGGGQWGEGLATQIINASLERLKPGGTLLLYTGVAIVEGRNVLYEQVRHILNSTAYDCRYEEMDPDVFGEELQTSNYENVERIAVVLLTLTRRDVLT